MPDLIVPTRHTRQPNIRLQIDRSNQLAQGLVGFWYPNAGNLSSMVRSSLDSSIVSGVGDANYKGRAFGSLTSAQSGLIPNDSSWQPTSAITIIAEGLLSQSGSNGTYLTAENLTSTAGFGIYENAGGINSYLRVGAAWAEQSSGASAGSISQVGMTYDGATFWALSNGKRNASQAITGSVTHSTVGIFLTIFVDGSGPTIGNFDYLAIWERALEPGELMSFYINPWQVMAQASQKLWPQDSGVVTGTSRLRLGSLGRGVLAGAGLGG